MSPGRLAVFAVALALAGCDDGGARGSLPPPPPTSRGGDAVAARDSGAPVATAAHPVAPVNTAPRQLCQGQTPRPAPKGNPKAVASPGVDAPPVPVPFGVGKWVWINFWAAWCGPCKAIAPIVDGVAKTYAGKLKVAKVDVDQNTATPSRYGIRGIPALLFFKGGKVADQVVGYVPQNVIEEKVQKLLA